MEKSKVEVIVLSGGHLAKFEIPDGYTWEHPSKPGTLDVLDRTIVDVLMVTDEGDLERFHSFMGVIAVGSMPIDTTFVLPEKQVRRCSKCKQKEE